uniref:Dynein heavy chain linker domain-containing protein n=1 Tax=Plectus sambesii TaxID=2011161 RepID=A0A914XH56_9BILA
MPKRSRRRHISCEIAWLFSPSARHLTVQHVQTIVRTISDEHAPSRACHQIYKRGKLLTDDSGVLRLPTIGDSVRLEPPFAVVGRKECLRTPYSRLSPEALRKRDYSKLVQDNEDVQGALDKIMKDISESDLPEWPGWSFFLHNLERSAPMLQYYPNHNVVKQKISEVFDLFNAWTKLSASKYLLQDIDQLKKFNITHWSFYKPHVCYNVRPSWRLNHGSQEKRMTAVLTCQASITKHFWTEIMPDISFDWNGFFSVEKERDWPLFQSVLMDFIDTSRKLLQNKWPIAVGRILLNNANKWEDLLLTEEIDLFFDSIAAVQAALVQQAIAVNCDALEKQLASRKRIPTLCIIIGSEKELESTELDINSLIAKIYDIGMEIPRVERKLYPEMKRKKQYLDVRQTTIQLNLGLQNLPLNSAFMSFQEKIAELQGEISEAFQSADDVLKWKECMDRAAALRLEILTSRHRMRNGQLLFDFATLKAVFLASLDQLEARLLAIALQEQSKQCHLIKQQYSAVAGKLHKSSDLLELISYMTEATEIALPALKQSVKLLHEKYWTILNNSLLPGWFYP